jgi:hypothetical protein
MQTAQTAEVEADGEPGSEEQRPLRRCVFSADGAMISLVKKQWVETRTVAIGEPLEKQTTDGETEIHVGHLSYFSRLADASTFTDLAEVEMRRRRVRKAQEVGAVMDGADWLQLFTDRHRPDAVRILDFPHAAEHVTKLLEALEQAGIHFAPHMLARCLHILKHRGPRSLLRIADRLERDLAQHKGVQEHLDYLRKREALMQYPQFRRDGWPIGSGMVESANKNIVEARLKGSGMHWERKHVNPMLALRTAVCNDRWQEMWQQALSSHHKLKALHRSARATQRAHTGPSAGHPCASDVPTAVSQEVPPSAPLCEATPPHSRLPAPRRIHRPARHRGNASPPGPREPSRDTCLCGRSLVRFKGHRPKQHCSDRCRQRAHRQRQAQIPSRLAFPQKLKQQARREQTHKRVQRSRQVFVWRDAQTCPCGTPLVQESF